MIITGLNRRHNQFNFTNSQALGYDPRDIPEVPSRTTSLQEPTEAVNKQEHSDNQDQGDLIWFSPPLDNNQSQDRAGSQIRIREADPFQILTEDI